VLAERLIGAYGDTLRVDTDLVSAACLLHDMGKVYTLPELPGGALPEAALDVDHVTRAALLIETAAARLDDPMSPDRLQRFTHAVLAHHGRKEWGAPVEPRTVEAWLVHLADYAESRLWQWSANREA
jgi:3'-5' exoribonuclease